MADANKNILIKPNISSSDSAPFIEFVGADSSIGDSATITLSAIPLGGGSTRFSGTSNDLLTITNDETNVIFSINKFDDSGTPLLEVTSEGIIKFAEFAGTVVIGGDSTADSGVASDEFDFLVVHKNVRLLNNGKFIGDGSSLTSLNADNLGSGTIPSSRLSASDLLTLIKTVDGAGSGLDADELDGISSANFLRSNTSDNFTSGTLEFADNTLLAFGTATDTVIEHDTGLTPDGTRFYANTSTGGMLFQDGSTTCFDVAYTAANTTTFFQSVDFNTANINFGTGTHDFETSSVDFTNATVTGLSTGGSGSGISGGVFLEYEKTVDSDYTIDSDGNGRGIFVLSAADDSDGLTIATGATVTVNSGSSWVLTGGDKNMGLDAMVATSNQTERTMRTGTIKPTLNNTYDLGDSAVAWRNIYTNDLNLSNETGPGNDVDGTTGKWTIQEGEDDLFIINRKTGKKYKFMLEEIV